MKNLLIILFSSILLSSNILLSQVIVSPYIVYMDEYNKFGSMIVQNESFEPYEISITFKFGYPISDSLGNRTMNYIENPPEDMAAINNWVNAFPKKFVLKSKERQTIRLMIKPPTNLNDGTYWTRIVTSSTPVQNNVDTNVTGVSAKLKFVLNQVTTAIYRNGRANTDLSISDPKLFLDSNKTYQLLYPLERKDNSPFFGYLTIRIFTQENELIKEEKDFISIYYSMVKNYFLPREEFTSGNYRAELTVTFNEKEDIPESKIPQKQDILNIFEFYIP